MSKIKDAFGDEKNRLNTLKCSKPGGHNIEEPKSLKRVTCGGRGSVGREGKLDSK